jgi:ATP-dependent Clp protease ATP-binding subunit ClpA
MFDRFTDRARRVLVVAQDEARSLNHSFIGPEHLLLGLMQGDGVAADALGQLGVNPHEVRATVTRTVAQAKTDMSASKVPFSPKAKKALETSLREALQLGHNYIGTEHILLGTLRVADADGAVTQLLGVDTKEVRARVVEAVSKTPTSDAPQSPAVVQALRLARQFAGPGQMTTGQLLLAMLTDDACQAKKALELLGVTTTSLQAQLTQIPIGGTSDARPRPRSVEIRLGRLTTTIDDPELAAALSELTPEQLGAALRDAFAADPEQGRSGSAS